MTVKAREVLSDCELALEFLEQGTTDQVWRVHWFAAVALVRSVGDVLDKVDGKQSAYERPVKDAYKAWKSDREANKIFWEFIKAQRDRLVHEYDTDAHPTDNAIIMLELSLATSAGGSLQKQNEIVELAQNSYRPMLAGPWEGDDARDVLQEAIDWWKRELAKIDEAAGATRR